MHWNNVNMNKGAAECSCERGNERPGSIKCLEILVV
jgi:hypothetical protein